MKQRIISTSWRIEKNTQNEQEKEKRFRKNEEGLRERHDNMKRNNICIIGIPEGKRRRARDRKLV